MNSTKRGKKGKPHVETLDGSSFDPTQQEYRWGYFGRSIEDLVLAFTEETGGQITFPSAARRLAGVLEAAAIREESRHPELVPEVRQRVSGAGRGRWPQYGYDGTAEAALHVHSRDSKPLKGRRRLSKAAIKRIKQAQLTRWAKYRASKPQTAKQKAYSDGAKGYWYNMTPEERSAEMIRRRQVAAAKRKKQSA